MAFAAIICLSFNPEALADSYTVRKGDTLWSIAKRHGTTVGALARANGISENAVLPIGKSLNVSPSVKPSAGSAARESTDLREVHTRVDSVVLRSGPGTDRSKIAVLPVGSTGKVLAARGSWTKVAFGDGTCGYVYSPLLSAGPGTLQYSPAEPVQTVASAPADRNSDLIQTALACRGDSYRRGGTSRGGFDCSGFTRYVFAKYGISLPHSSAAQARLGTPVARNELKAGDLVFFETYRRGISHVGIYVGGDQFVHAPRYGRSVTTDSLSSGYYASRYRGARRIR